VHRAVADLGSYKTQHMAALAWAFAQLPALAQLAPPSAAARPAAEAGLAPSPPVLQAEPGTSISSSEQESSSASTSSSSSSIISSSDGGGGTAVPPQDLPARTPARQLPAAPQDLATSLGLWPALEAAAVQKVQMFKPVDLAATIWALVAQGQRCTRLLHAAADAVRKASNDYSLEDVVQLLGAAASLEVVIPGLNAAAARVVASGKEGAGWAGGGELGLRCGGGGGDGGARQGVECRERTG